MAKIRERKTDELCQRFQAIEGMLFILSGILDALKNAETAAERAWKHLQKKYDKPTEEELVAEVNQDFFDGPAVEKIPGTENAYHFPEVGAAVIRTQRRLETMLDDTNRNSIAAAVRRLRLEHNQILRELQRRKIAQVANKRMLEI